jgi:hypothetical protein
VLCDDPNVRRRLFDAADPLIERLLWLERRLGQRFDAIEHESRTTGIRVGGKGLTLSEIETLIGDALAEGQDLSFDPLRRAVQRTATAIAKGSVRTGEVWPEAVELLESWVREVLEPPRSKEAPEVDAA